MIKKNWTILLLALIVILALLVRVYKLDQIPPSINWDEASVGYNAYTIANWGRDEWGKTFPITFKSFGDDKSPIHIYFTALSVGILGLSEFSTRLPSAIFGVINVAIIFYLGKTMFKSKFLALLAAFFLAISPFNIQFSRFNHEANFALFFFMLGLLFFFKAIYQNPPLLIASTLAFCISMITYHSPKVVVPLMVIVLSLLYFKNLLNIKRHVFGSGLVLVLFAFLIFFNPTLLGLARAAQTNLPEEAIYSTKTYKQTKNKFLGTLHFIWERYLTHFSSKYLFESGDPIPRHSIQTVGEFYKVDLIFLILGILYLIYQRSRQALVLVAWVLFAPIPAAITGSITEISHSARASLQMGGMHLIAASGFYLIINFFKKKELKFLVLSLGIVTLSYFFRQYMLDYYNEYAKKSAIEWQYGMKEIVSYVKDNPKYGQVYMTRARGQPYIFFLYYLKTPLPDFLRTAILNNNPDSRSYNRIALFERYIFEGWDPIESNPHPNILYIVTPSQYDGLKHRIFFDVKKLVRYPDGGDAYFLVSINQ